MGYEYKLSAGRRPGYDAMIEVHEIDKFIPTASRICPRRTAFCARLCARRSPCGATKFRFPPIERYVDTIVQSGLKAGCWKDRGDGENGRTLAARARRSYSSRSRCFPISPKCAFAGNDALPAATLLRPISDVAIGIPYTEKALRERLDAAIRPLYELAAAFAWRSRKSRWSRPRSWTEWMATVTVEEGPVYRLGEVRFTGVADSGDGASFRDWRI